MNHIISSRSSHNHRTIPIITQRRVFVIILFIIIIPSLVLGRTGDGFGGQTIPYHYYKRINECGLHLIPALHNVLWQRGTVI